PLHALRSDNKVLLQKYEDIQPIDLEGAVWQALRQIGTASSPALTPGTSQEAMAAIAPDVAEEVDATIAPQESQAFHAEDEQKKSKERVEKGEKGLIETVTEARQHDLTAYAALKKGGFLRDGGEYLGEEVKA